MELPRTRRKTLTNSILLVLEKSIDGFVRVDDFARHHYRYHYGYPDLQERVLSQALKRLRERGLIELINDQKLAWRLTDEGKMKAIKVHLSLNNNKWDGKYRIVIFDIPEKRRSARDILRHNLKNWGFIPWQQSVWVTKKNCAKILREYIKKIGIEDWVLVIESDNIGR
jgi:DNA-binding transcriptional regulator PaaX